MSAPRSIVVRVARTYVTGIALAALSIVLVSALVGSVVVVWQDDRAAIALGRTLAIELGEPSESEAVRDAFIHAELAEQHWFARRIEVWRAGTRLGADASESALAAYARNADAECVLGTILDRISRVCVVRAGTGESIVLSAPLATMLEAMLPLLVAVASVALVVMLLVALIGRRAITASVAPLARFEAEVAAIPARATSRTITRAWGGSELDSLAATFQAMLTRIDEASAREQRFVSDAAHELRTPLTRLRAQLEIAREELREGRPIEARLAAAAKTAVELGTTSEVLLAMAQGTMGKTEPVELEDVVEAAIARLDDADRARVRFERGPQTIADAVEPMLVLAASNLIDNALKYTDARIAVSLEHDVAGDAVVLVVTDEGGGIPESELDRIREPFVRGASASSVRGAGLGLALTDHIARLHGGSLTLENRAPRGLRASIRLRPWRAPA